LAPERFIRIRVSGSVISSRSSVSSAIFRLLIVGTSDAPTRMSVSVWSIASSVAGAKLDDVSMTTAS